LVIIELSFSPSPSRGEGWGEGMIFGKYQIWGILTERALGGQKDC
jgi:hypothetical protein